MSTICRAMSSPQRAWASFVLAPRWGQLMTLGCSTSEWFLGGSCSQKHKDNGKLNNNISLFNKKKGQSINLTKRKTSTKTSRPAPPHCPDSKALSRASSSMMPPLAQFTTFTPFLHLAKLSSLSRPWEHQREIPHLADGLCATVIIDRHMIGV